MNKNKLINILARFGYPLMIPDSQPLHDQIEKVLIELVDTDDSRLMEGFPVVLTYCAVNGIAVDYQAILREAKTGGRREAMEKLLLLSWNLMKSENIDTPAGLDVIAGSLEKKYGDIFSAESIPLRRNSSLSVERLRRTYERYIHNLQEGFYTESREADSQYDAFLLHMHLSRLFSPKQKEILLKKYHGDALNKTEREYYSRTVKKKLKALASEDVRNIADTLIRESK